MRKNRATLKALPAYLHFCPVMRRKLVTHGTLSLATGEIQERGKTWSVEPCNASLFGNDQSRGMCRSCGRGWNVPTNYRIYEPVTEGEQ